MLYECLLPRLKEYVRNNEAVKCRCPRQCRLLAYEYIISQAQISNFHILFSKDVYNLNNYTTDILRNEQCVLEVLMSLSQCYQKILKTFVKTEKYRRPIVLTA